MREKGIVKWFNAAKGYGFVQRANGEDVFVHFNAIKNAAHRDLTEGSEIEFEVTAGPKGLQAANVTSGEPSISDYEEHLQGPQAEGGLPREGLPQTNEDFEIVFDAELTDDQIREVFMALADYYRCCGGIGLSVEFEPEEIDVREPVRV